MRTRAPLVIDSVPSKSGALPVTCALGLACLEGKVPAGQVIDTSPVPFLVSVKVARFTAVGFAVTAILL